MKHLITYLVVTLASTTMLCQEDDKKTNPDNISTTVITLDLAKPHEQSINHSNNKNKLVVKNRDPLAFVLVNGNPFKFKYRLNYKTISLFGDDPFNPSIDDLKPQGQFDQDGDGIPDSRDLHPDTPDAPTIEAVIGLQNDIQSKFEKLESDIESFVSDISDDETLDIEEFKLSTANFKDSFLKHSKSFEDMKKIYSLLPSPNSAVVQKQDELIKLQESVRKSIEKLTNTRTHSTYILPIDINGDNIDFVEIQLDIFEGDNEEPITYKYKVWVQGGLKIDFSGGVFITSLFDREYETLDVGSETKALYELDNGEYDFGFGTMVNISLRGGSWVKPALNFGALFTSNQKFQMLTGIGLILGKNERFILHGGLAMGRVNVLKDNFVADGATPYNLGADGSVPLTEKFKFGNYFGITYNFNKPKSKDKSND